MVSILIYAEAACDLSKISWFWNAVREGLRKSLKHNGKSLVSREFHFHYFVTPVSLRWLLDMVESLHATEDFGRGR
jgi:hypothetical protein